MERIPALNPSVRRLLSASPLQYMFDAVAEAPQLAEIYVDDAQAPKACALLLGHYLFLGHADGDFLAALWQTVFTAEKQKALGTISVYYGDADEALRLKGLCAKVYDGVRSVYRCTPVPGSAEDPEDIVPVTEALLAGELDNREMIVREVIGTATYADMHDFCRRGIGYALVRQNRVRGFCTSEYPSRAALAVGIEVEEACRRQGRATAMARALLRKAASRGMTVYWDCWLNNEASARTALRCGFGKAADYPALILVMA
jgi:GNAT superfamily N-acetyltransferase